MQNSIIRLQLKFHRCIIRTQYTDHTNRSVACHSDTGSSAWHMRQLGKIVVNAEKSFP